ncbi:MAG: lipoyl(octanoyl) transferase LipB [Bacteroidia bacterium]|nr:lipoyl(octanoyl) transferase LipB [Bacteroidia bacterium]
MSVFPSSAQPVHFQDLGLIAYQEAWDLQESLLRVNVGLKQSASKVAANKIATQHYLLFCEHPHVYTLGKSGEETHLLIDEATRREKGISYFKINRGGDITYHGPGQITGYPIFDLEKFKPDLGWYLRTMEEVMIRLLAEYGLDGGRIEGATGVWLGVETPSARKICAFGVKCSRWITMHGFAFNVNTDLGLFDHIVPCGIADKGVTSLQKELGHQVSMEEVKKKLKALFGELFGIEYVVE